MRVPLFAATLGLLLLTSFGLTQWFGTGAPLPQSAPELATTDPAEAHTAAEASDATLPYYPPNRGAGWTSLGVTAAHAAMVMRLTVDDGYDPMAIARDIVEPLMPSYVEILLYVHDAEREAAMPRLRIQWTPGRGYVATDYLEMDATVNREED